MIATPIVGDKLVSKANTGLTAEVISAKNGAYEIRIAGGDTAKYSSKTKLFAEWRYPGLPRIIVRRG